MIPRIQRRGYSFKGITAYLMHDKGALTSERVAWTATGNLRTNDIFKAATIMAFTDMRREEMRSNSVGARSKAGNVYHTSLSWAAGEKPRKEHQRETVQAYLKHQGLDKHQYYMVGHRDTDHAHVHIVVNLVNPRTGKIHELAFDKRKAQKWALEYECRHGLHCQVREQNEKKRKVGKSTKYREQKQDYSTLVTHAYHASDSGKAFVHALGEKNLFLCAARRGSGFVIVDARGDIQKLARQLDIEEKGRAKTAAINRKLADLDHSALPDADELSVKLRQQEHMVAKKPALPLYKRVDRDREREMNSKRRVEIDEVKAYYRLDAHRLEVKKANALFAAKQGFFARLFGQQRKAREGMVAARLCYEDTKRKQQQAIDAINKRYHYRAPEPVQSSRKTKRMGLTREYKQASQPAYIREVVDTAAKPLDLLEEIAVNSS